MMASQALIAVDLPYFQACALFQAFVSVGTVCPDGGEQRPVCRISGSCSEDETHLSMQSGIKVPPVMPVERHRDQRCCMLSFAAGATTLIFQQVTYDRA
jgi:hypothetical protein